RCRNSGVGRRPAGGEHLDPTLHRGRMPRCDRRLHRGQIVTLRAHFRHTPVRSSALRSQRGGGWWPPRSIGPERGETRELLPFRETAVSAVRECFLAARLDCGVTLEGGGLTLTKEAKQDIDGKHG